MAKPPPITKPGKPRGRPAHQPTEKDRAWVKMCVAGGIEQENMAAVLAIRPATLRKHYKRELRIGATEADVIVIAALFKNCREGDTKAQIHWTLTRCRWSIPQVVENVGKDGKPMEHVYRWAEPVKE